MIHRLQTRLLLTFVGIAAVALLLVVLFALLATRTQFDAYVTRDSIISLNQAAQLFRRAMVEEDIATLQDLSEEVANTYQASATVYDETGHVIAASDEAQVGQTIDDEPLPRDGLALRLVSEDSPSRVSYFFLGEEQGRGTVLMADERGPAYDLTYFQPPSGTLSSAGRLVAGGWRNGDGPEVAFIDSAPQPFTLPLTATMPITAPAMLVDTVASQQTFWSLVNRGFLWAAGASVVVAVALSWFTSRRVVQPVNDLAAAVRRMGRGEMDARVAVQGDDELANLGRSFNQMAADLARQETLRRHLVTDVAHELLTPLTMVRGNLEAIQDGLLTPDGPLIDSLHDEVMLLDSLITDLQELSLAEAGQMRLDWQDIAIIDVIEEAVKAIQPQAIAKDITISVDVPEHLPLVPMDARRMGQVFRNLLANGITYTEPGGHIKIVARLLETAVQIDVQDSGSGIAPEDLPHVFDRFYRGDKSRARTTGGSGLGLAIVKGIVEAHNGRVWVGSYPGQGATFSLTLPMARAAGHSSASRQARRWPAGRSTARRCGGERLP